jgi:nucleoside-diphosphate-sugar epimerase
MTDQMTVLVTGSDGFIGRHLVPYLATHGFKGIAASRSAVVNGRNISAAALPDLSTPFDWAWLLERCDTVVHLAGIAHTYADEDLYDRINHRATEALARTAARLDKHLVFISSIAAQSGSFSDRDLTQNGTRSSSQGSALRASERRSGPTAPQTGPYA